MDLKILGNKKATWLSGFESTNPPRDYENFTPKQTLLSCQLLVKCLQ